MFDWDITQLNDTDFKLLIEYNGKTNIADRAINMARGRLRKRVNMEGIKAIDEWNIPKEYQKMAYPAIKRLISKDVQTVMDTTSNDGFIINEWWLKEVIFKKSEKQYYNLKIDIRGLFSRV